MKLVPILMTTLALAACGSNQAQNSSLTSDVAASSSRSLTVSGAIVKASEVELEDGKVCLVDVATESGRFGVVDGRVYSCDWKYNTGDKFHATTQKMSDWSLIRELKSINSELFYVQLGPAAGEATIKEVATPVWLDRAVNDNYSWGRDMADFGGIAKVRQFDLGRTLYAPTKTILKEMILATANPVGLSYEWSLDDLYSFCYGDLGVAVVDECAEKLASEHGAGPDALSSWVSQLQYEDATDPEQISFNADLQTIVDAIENDDEDIAAFAMVGSGLNVDILYFVYINRSTGQATFILGDWGA